MYIHDVYHMLPDKMAISHSSHLFGSVAFVFCLLSLLIHASDLYSKSTVLYFILFSLFYTIYSDCIATITIYDVKYDKPKKKIDSNFITGVTRKSLSLSASANRPMRIAILKEKDRKTEFLSPSHRDPYNLFPLSFHVIIKMYHIWYS